MHNYISYIILAIVVLSYIFSILSDYLNIKALNPNLPDEMSDTYDAEKYKKSQLYTKEKTNLGFISVTSMFFITVFMIIFDGFALLNTIVCNWFENSIWQALAFFGIIAVIISIIELPFDYFFTFVIEQKYGFNKSTKKTFWFDKIKGLLLTVIIGGGLGYLLLWILTSMPSTFVLWAFVVIASFSIFFAMFYTSLIVPLFNKLVPLPEGELRTSIEEFSKKSGFKLKNIYSIDGSKRSTKANAYFSGLGPKKTIVLFDTLIDLLTPQEVVAVLAHEIGHNKKQHILKSLAISLLTTASLLFILQIMLKYQIFSQALGVEQIKIHISLIAFGILLEPISTILNFFTNLLSRKFEYQADNFAKKHNLAQELVSSLKKLSINNLSNLTPHKLYVLLHYSHPPLIERIRNLKSSNN